MCLGYKIPIPPKSKGKEWEQLRESYYRSQREQQLSRSKMKVRDVHGIEQEIVRLRAMPKNPGRERAIKLLAKSLVVVRA